MQKRLFALSMGLSMTCALWLVSRDAATYGTALAVLAAVTAIGLACAKQAGGLLVALAVLNAITVLPELALRARDFQFVSGVQFGYPTPDEFWELVPDDVLFWRLPPGDNPPVNSYGFFGDDPQLPKPEGTWRLVVLGDSCSQQGWPASYPDLLAQALRSAGVWCDLVNLSLSGYSTQQGRALAEGVLQTLEPDAVLVWYGWNDHWQAYGSTDAQKRPSLRNERLYRQSRLLQGLRKLALDTGIAAAPAPLETVRVPTDDYRSNLNAIVRASRRAGAEVALITAPSSHPRLGVPTYLVERDFAPTGQDVLDRHAEYTQLVRELADGSGARLCDLERDLDRQLRTEGDLRTVFLEDGIHLTEVGRKLVATHLAAWLRSEGMLPE